MKIIKQEKKELVNKYYMILLLIIILLFSPSYWNCEASSPIFRTIIRYKHFYTI